MPCLQMKRHLVPSILTLIVLSAAGCSNRGLYDSIQASNRTECGKLPQGEFEECMARNEKSYDEYEREVGESEEP
jgi:hypothetical protein